MTEVQRAKAGGDDFLEKFPVAFKEGNRAVGFSEGVVRFLRFRDDYDLSITPRVKVKA